MALSVLMPLEEDNPAEERIPTIRMIGRVSYNRFPNLDPFPIFKLNLVAIVAPTRASLTPPRVDPSRNVHETLVIVPDQCHRSDRFLMGTDRELGAGPVNRDHFSSPRGITDLFELCFCYPGSRAVDDVGSALTTSGVTGSYRLP